MPKKVIGVALGALILALGATTNAQAATVLEGTGRPRKAQEWSP
jgi:hypothetical protein